jgi:antirestriction protein ArdC
MTEEIKVQQTAEEATSAVPAGHQASTVTARQGAERKERKPMVSWAALLENAVKKPGHIHEAYSRFWNYSIANQLLALFQILARGAQPGPLATFKKWKELGRHVKKGEKAISLRIPVSCSSTKTVKKDDGTTVEEAFTFNNFLLKARWFTVHQTEGTEYQPTSLPDWNEQKALETLQIERVPFEDLDGNTQGYALRGQKIAVSPIAETPSRTLFHELGHQLLGHCDESDLTDSEVTPRDIREMEAEAVALLCCESLGLEGAVFSRGYIQSWGQGQTFTERSAQRIFHAADRILKAGYSHDSATDAP